MKKYFILDAATADKLSALVIVWLNQGWQLQGGVAVVPDPRGFRYHQAMFNPNCE